MKYVLNETPIRTSNNFKINDFIVDLDINKTNFNKYDITNVEYNESIKNNFDSKIGLKDDKYLNIDIDIKENKDKIFLNYEFDDNNYLVSQININLLKNTTSNFVILYKSKNDAFNNSKIVINASDNSKSNISIINLLSNNSKSFISIENVEKDNADININFIDLGGNLKISNYYGKLDGINSKNNFNNIYMGINEDKIDMNFYLSNNNKNTIGNILSNGSLDNNSIKAFKGTIDFIEGCSKSIGEENENCILLSDTCISRSLPMLLCHEEDVQGAHGVSTGKIDESKLFYLMSKGISEKAAKKLIINANFNDIINEISNEEIKQLVIEEIDKKLN
ncbi:MAG: SufD family Fe-S cluster assembly protein [Bacilli bacterium]|nr:SufD family Fe-S cluster assembly protein [Bacilli bacterium]